MDEVPLLRLTGVSKKFGNGTVALRGVNIDIEKGKVHGLLGANGAGKSTMIRILCGAFVASGGRMEWNGVPVEITNPKSANDLGIATIHQNIPLVPQLSVFENIFLREQGLWRHSQGARDRYRELCERIDYQLDPDALVEDLTIGRRQMVAIMAAVISGAELIVMDEPTASLSTQERELVYRVVRQLSRQEGKAILFVSHFLDEIVDLTDRVTVLRDGVSVMEAETRDLTEAKIAEAIVGKEVIVIEGAARERRPRNVDPGATPLLELRNLASLGRVAPISLRVEKGEVLGIAGLLGSGRSELIHAIYGADPEATGEVILDGMPLRRTVGAAVHAGMALVPEDRNSQGLFVDSEIWRNVSFPALASVSRLGFLPDREQELARAEHAIKQFGIKADSPHVLVSELSGGNAQKVTIARWAYSDVKLFLLDEPTAGIDIGAKTEILKLVRQLASEGRAVIVVSSEFEELLAVCDRIMVLREGRVTADLEVGMTSEHDLVLLAGGERPVAARAGSSEQGATA